VIACVSHLLERRFWIVSGLPTRKLDDLLVIGDTSPLHSLTGKSVTRLLRDKSREASDYHFWPVPHTDSLYFEAFGKGNED
jgi:hypothetical protein